MSVSTTGVNPGNLLYVRQRRPSGLGLIGREMCEQRDRRWASYDAETAIADRWTALVIGALAGGTMRHGELQRRIGGVSQKMLTHTLRSLEYDGLVARRVHPVVPPKVEYTLTPLGRTPVGPLDAVRDWAETHLSELLVARKRSASRLGSETADAARGGAA